MATVVFADLVGSTSLFERLGDETASRFVTQLTGALSQVFEQHDGRVVKLLGDGLFVLFPLESDALAACIAIQKRLVDKPIRPGGAGAPVQMQMGIESGEVVEIAGDCFGDTVNSAARLGSGGGGPNLDHTKRVLPVATNAAGIAEEHRPYVPERKSRVQPPLQGRMAPWTGRRSHHDGSLDSHQSVCYLA